MELSQNAGTVKYKNFSAAYSVINSSPETHGDDVAIHRTANYPSQMERRILIEDELDFSELVQYRLSDSGYCFSTATNSTDAHPLERPSRKRKGVSSKL